MTPQEIFEYKMKWSPGITVDVHSDLDWKYKDWCRRHLERHQWSMDTFTDNYQHTLRFESQEYADLFKEEFEQWVKK